MTVNPLLLFRRAQKDSQKIRRRLLNVRGFIVFAVSVPRAADGQPGVSRSRLLRRRFRGAGFPAVKENAFFSGGALLEDGKKPINPGHAARERRSELFGGADNSDPVGQYQVGARDGLVRFPVPPACRRA